jgi:hypothetical protein
MRFCMSSGLALPCAEFFLRVPGAANEHDEASPRRTQFSHGWERLHFNLRVVSFKEDPISCQMVAEKGPPTSYVDRERRRGALDSSSAPPGTVSYLESGLPRWRMWRAV